MELVFEERSSSSNVSERVIEGANGRKWGTCWFGSVIDDLIAVLLAVGLAVDMTM